MKKRHRNLCFAVLTIFPAMKAHAEVGNLFYCESSILGSLTINMNFGEWFNDKGGGGEARFGSKRSVYELEFDGKTAQLIHSGVKSKLIFSDGSVVKLNCDTGGTGQTPGE
jgi:hypothetical protein